MLCITLRIRGKFLLQATSHLPHSFVCASMGNHKHILKINLGYLLNHLKLFEKHMCFGVGVLCMDHLYSERLKRKLYTHKTVYTKQW